MTNNYNQSRSFNLGIAQDFDIATALLFDELSFWADKGKRTDGYIYKTIEELQERLPLSKYQINKAQNNLVETGFLEKKIMRANGSPTTHYRLLKNLTLESKKTSLSESKKTSLSITATNTATNNKEQAFPETIKQQAQELHEALGHDTKVRSKEHYKKLKARLDTFTFDELKAVATKINQSEWHVSQGHNNLATMLQNDTYIEKWLIKKEENHYEPRPL